MRFSKALFTICTFPIPIAFSCKHLLSSTNSTSGTQVTCISKYCLFLNVLALRVSTQCLEGEGGLRVGIPGKAFSFHFGVDCYRSWWLYFTSHIAHTHNHPAQPVGNSCMLLLGAVCVMDARMACLRCILGIQTVLWMSAIYFRSYLNLGWTNLAEAS